MISPGTILDGLNSRLFQASPFKNSRTARLLWTQLCKRSPINFRQLVRIPQERNAKGTSLFTLAALANYRSCGSKETEIDARELLDSLMTIRLPVSAAQPGATTLTGKGARFSRRAAHP